MNEVTRILSAIEGGDPHAAEQLLPLVYEELRRLAAARRNRAKRSTRRPWFIHRQQKSLPDGKRLVSAAVYDGTVKVWDSQTGQELLNLKVGGNVFSLAFNPDGHWLASDPGGTVTIWDATPLPEKP